MPLIYNAHNRPQFQLILIRNSKKNFLSFSQTKEHFLHFNVSIRFDMVKFHLIWINCIWKHISFWIVDLNWIGPTSAFYYILQTAKRFSINCIRTFRLFCSSIYFRLTSHSFQDCVINNPKNYAADFSILKIFFVFLLSNMRHYNNIATKVRFSVSGTVNKIVHEKTSTNAFFPFLLLSFAQIFNCLDWIDCR